MKEFTHIYPKFEKSTNTNKSIEIEIKNIKGNRIKSNDQVKFQNRIEKLKDTKLWEVKSPSTIFLDEPIKSVSKCQIKIQQETIKDDLHHEDDDHRKYTNQEIQEALKEFQKSLNKISIELGINGQVNQIYIDTFERRLNDLEAIYRKM